MAGMKQVSKKCRVQCAESRAQGLCFEHYAVAAGARSVAVRLQIKSVEALAGTHSAVTRFGELPSLIGFLLVLLFSVPAFANERLVVVTAYPEEVTTLYQRVFEAAHRDISVQILWKQGRDAFALLSAPDHGGADVYWAASSDNFPMLRDRGAFQTLDVDRNALPGQIGEDRLSDPDNRFEAFEVAGYGLAFGPQARWQGKAPPRSWHAAASPDLEGLVLMPTASRIGFAPSLYDIILQGEGWEKGWALLSEISGNAVLSTNGHMLDAIEDGRAALAMTIDFIPLSAAANGHKIGLAYPARTAFLPAHVAKIADASHPEAAQIFIDFLLSQEGQKLLLEPDVNRHPVRPDVYPASSGAEVNPFRLPASVTLVFDHSLAGARRSLVSALFETAIVEHHDRTVALWHEIHAAEKRLAETPDTTASARIAEARRLAGLVPVSKEDATNRNFLANINPRPGVVPAEVLSKWRVELAEAHRKAFAILAEFTQQ
jgi:ABC-type Fe3+ transport system substrate-binding protein